MIEIEFRRPAAGSGYAVVATIRVDDDGTVTAAGADVDMVTEVAIADRTRPSGRLTLAEDPVAWIRNAHKAFRTPYLVPAVTRDEEPSVFGAAARALV
jgi:hypothetical protein